ncbi:hypothetical protein ONS96_013523 [Cadophora gregata f. sp. sojae]|nr:hypothetical protein ONS96_013523 [Cadophora gregata f. sp. sojae]
MTFAPGIQTVFKSEALNLAPIQGMAVPLGDSFYYLRPEARAKIDTPHSGLVPRPATVLTFRSTGSLNASDVAANLAQFESSDDVYTKEFSSTIIVQQHASLNGGLDSSAVSMLQDKGELFRLEVPEVLPEGPYFILNGSIFEAWRLYPDTIDSFFVATKLNRGERKSYSRLELSGIFPPALAIAVPSRLYFMPSEAKPLNGLRVAVKDILNIEGIHTSNRVKDWLKFHSPASEIPPAVQKLMDLGAVIVGKTKCTAFADREYHSSDWINYHLTFNPRACGYLVPEGSSTGSAAALAASARLRMPAGAQGLFGLRLTYGMASMENVTPLVKEFDTEGLLARDIKTMQLVSGVWYGHKEEADNTKDWSDSSTDHPAKAIFDSFVVNLEAFMELKRINVNVKEGWTNDDPMKTGKTFEEEFLRVIFPTPLKNLCS